MGNLTKYKPQFFIAISSALVCGLVSFANFVSSAQYVVEFKRYPADYWFHQTDFPNFLVLTALYSILVAVLGLGLSRYLLRKGLVFRLACILVSTPLIVSLWTVIAAQLLWPLFREVELATFIPWALGCFTGLIIALILSLRLAGQAGFRAALKESPHIIGGVLVGSFVGFFIAVLLSFYLDFALVWQVVTQPVYFLLPQYYQGPILVVFDQPNGTPPKYDGRARVYEIPANGVLLTQFSQVKQVYGDKFWYVDTDGNKTALPYSTDNRCGVNWRPYQLGVCSNTSSTKHAAYLVGYMQDPNLKHAYEAAIGPLYEQYIPSSNNP